MFFKIQYLTDMKEKDGYFIYNPTFLPLGVQARFITIRAFINGEPPSAYIGTFTFEKIGHYSVVTDKDLKKQLGLVFETNSRKEQNV